MHVPTTFFTVFVPTEQIRTGCHSQILLITLNLRLTAVFVTFREGSFAIITFDLEP